MKIRQILILGDCIATGQNCLMPEITGEEIFPDFAVNSNFEKDIILWYLKNNKKDKKNANDLLKLAYAYKRSKEKEIAWPALLDQPVINLAVSGETFQGMHHKIKNYIEKNNKPDLILITDFYHEHNCVVVNKNKKFVVKRDTAFIDQPQDVYPPDVYEIFKTRANEQRHKGTNYQIRKTIKSFYQLEKVLEKNNINYRLLCFRNYHKKYIWYNKNFVDCTEFISKYRSTNEDNCIKKLQAQKFIADFLKTKI